MALCLASIIAMCATNAVEGPLTRWIESHPTFQTSRLSYVSAWQYAFGWLEALFTLGCAACVVASFLTRRDSRVWRRLINGQCPACGYPIGTSDVCTECGSEIPRAFRNQRTDQ